MTEAVRTGPGLGEGKSPAGDLLETMPFEIFEIYRSKNGAGIPEIVDSLNAHSEHRLRQPVVIDHIFFANPKRETKVLTHRLDDEDVILGQFEGFTLTEEEEPRLAVKILVNLTPDSSPGVFREETLPLWIPDQETLRWLNFDYAPTRKKRLWLPFFKMS